MRSWFLFLDFMKMFPSLRVCWENAPATIDSIYFRFSLLFLKFAGVEVWSGRETFLKQLYFDFRECICNFFSHELKGCKGNVANFIFALRPRFFLTFLNISLRSKRKIKSIPFDSHSWCNRDVRNPTGGKPRTFKANNRKDFSLSSIAAFVFTSRFYCLSISHVIFCCFNCFCRRERDNNCETQTTAFAF